MWKVEKPTHTARYAFTTCISKVKNPGLKGRLVSITQDIVDASDEYDNAAQRESLHTIATATMVGTVTQAEMKAVYDGRMVKLTAPGRAIYDDLLAAAKGKCPLCGKRQATTIDHHLPKKHYPALAVAPFNLVPACYECNKAKQDKIPTGAKDVTLHPYYDDVDSDRWLAAEVVQTAPAAVKFRVQAPAHWSEDLKERTRYHFKVLGLRALYATEAADELLNIRHQLLKIFRASGANGVREELIDRAASCNEAGKNGWRTATYEAFVGSDWFCNGGFANPG